MAKQPNLTISRIIVESDIQREIAKGKSPVEAVCCVMGNARKGLHEASTEIELLIRNAKGYENLTGEQKATYDRLLSTIIDPETQRIGHCKNIIVELTKPK